MKVEASSLSPIRRIVLSRLKMRYYASRISRKYKQIRNDLGKLFVLISWCLGLMGTIHGHLYLVSMRL